jgi:hypothetical protein
MFHYIKCAANGTATGHESVATEKRGVAIEIDEEGNAIAWRPGYNTAEASAENGKPYLVPAELVDPAFDPATQTRTGPTYELDPARIVYTVTDKAVSAVRAERKKELCAVMETKMGAVVAEYAPIERDTWGEQVKAALSYESDAGANDYLEGMTKEGETVAELATTILANRSAYLLASVAFVRRRRELTQELDGANSISAVMAVDLGAGWPS